jgi:predicted dehydrogenase
MQGAVIGCGFFAQNHLQAWRDMRGEGISLVAVCDLDEGKARSAAAKFGINRFYTDAAKMLENEKLDFVDIATRMDTHRLLALAAIERGLNLVVQKPFAPEWEDCVEIVRQATNAGVRLAVHENVRYQTSIQRVQETLKSGVIGVPSWARISFRTGYDIYKNQPYFRDEVRFAILDCGIHYLDLARFLLGEVAHLSCESQRRGPENRGEDTATMLLRHQNGAVCLVDHSYEAKQIPDYFPQTLITIEGPRGSIKLNENYRMVVTSNGEVFDYDVSSPLLPWTFEPWHMAQESVLHTQRAIINAWRHGRDAETSGVDNLKTFALAEAAYESAATQKFVVPKTF